MILEPISERVYVKLDPVQEEKVKGVWLPDKHSVPSRIGTVLAVGSEARKFKVGDRVLVMYYSGVAIELSALMEPGDLQDVHRILNQDEILARIGE